MGPIRRFVLLFSLLIFVVLLGCDPFLSKQISESLDRPKVCEELLQRLDEEVEEAGFRDASAFPVPGFPYLRTHRFLSALKRDLRDENAGEAWVRWMQELDLKARRKEIRNLLPRKGDEEHLIAEVEACSSELLNHDLKQNRFYASLDSVLSVPDEYSFWMRSLGLYPFVALPVALVTENSRRKARSRFDGELGELPTDGKLRSFVPEKKTILDEREIEEILKDSAQNPLGVPLLSEEQEKSLVESFAPIFIQDVAAPYDRLGRIVWKDHRVTVDTERPTVYYYLSHAFFKGRPILQINYVIWYPERAGKRSPWIERGSLDGLTARISIDHRGRPFMADVVNDCGCYHLFAPDQERIERIVSRPFGFDPFVPQWLPSIASGERLGVRMNSGWHQVQRLISAQEPPDAISYELMPYDVLETLPLENGNTESIFDSKGIAKNSERVERFILFSMGIPSIGSMRQRGHHAIELIGRIHFDDPDLFDKNFVFK